MRAGRGVLVPDLGQTLFREPRSKLHERWPQPPVDVRHLSVDQLADQYVRALTDGLDHTEDLVTLRMAPPATSDWAARDRLRKARDRPSRSLKYHSVALDECQSLVWAHTTLRSADVELSAERLSSAAKVSRPAMCARRWRDRFPLSVCSDLLGDAFIKKRYQNSEDRRDH